MATNPLTASDVGAVKRKTLRISLFAIASVFVFEFVAGIMTNSLALLTDSTHALLDVVVTLVLMIAATMALKPRDKDHNYGHGKIETVGGFIGGTALFVVAIFFIYEAIARIAVLDSPGVARPATIGFAAIAYTLAVDIFRITILLKAARKTAAATIRADLYHSFADFASTVVALVGLWLLATGFSQGDSIAAIILGGVLAFLSVKFVYQNASELTDNISPNLVSLVRKSAAATDDVLECKDVKVRRVGREIFVDVTVSLHAHISFENAHYTSDKVEENIADAIKGAGMHVSDGNITVHFEPTSKESTPETLVEMAAGSVAGVWGVHNILVSKMDEKNSIGVSLHIQVNKDATLSEAHSLSDAVEDSIRKHLKGVESITVHLEPHMPQLLGVHRVPDELKESVRAIILGRKDVEKLGRIEVYETDRNLLKIDVGCVFRKGGDREMTIEEIHEQVSEIEKEIRSRYPGSIVTIHAEPD